MCDSWHNSSGIKRLLVPLHSVPCKVFSETESHEGNRKGRGRQAALWLLNQQPLRDEEENDAGNKPSSLVCSL